ncbi:MAG TPA: hypothetical protein DEG43_17745, partial [Acidimicrobiaceae bacterium]|nr:hypothetical protein [Acidimicrobiaceae bacterium]
MATALPLWGSQPQLARIDARRTTRTAPDCVANQLLEPPMPRRTDISSILIIGSGPIVIGQACEFD